MKIYETLIMYLSKSNAKKDSFNLKEPGNKKRLKDKKNVRIQRDGNYRICTAIEL